MRCQASCRVEFGTCVFFFFFSGGCNRGVSGPSCCDLILGGTFDLWQGIRPYLEWMGNSVSLKLWQDPQVPLQFQFETDLLFRCDGDVGISFQMKQGI